MGYLHDDVTRTTRMLRGKLLFVTVSIVKCHEEAKKQTKKHPELVVVAN